MEGNAEVSRPAPVEVLRNKERLLNKETTGAQALMILGITPPKPGESIILSDANKDNIRKCNEIGIPSGHKEKINKASFNEREEYWENRKDIKKEDRIDEWKRRMNDFLDVYKRDATKTAEQTFLKNILGLDVKKSLDEVNADSIYKTFMEGDGKGDVDFFAKRIVETNTFDEIEANQDLIRNLGNIYGKNSAKISELLTHGRANVKEDSEAFIKSAQENLIKGNYGEEGIWTELDRNSKDWEEIKAKKAVEEKQRQEQEGEAEKQKKEEQERIAKAAEDKKRQDEEARRQAEGEAGLQKEKDNEKKIETPDIHPLEKDQHKLSDAYEVVVQGDKEGIKKEWRAHPNLEIQTSEEPVVIEEDVIREYNDLVVEKAKATGNEVPFFFVEDRDKNRIVKIFVGEATSYGSTALSPLTSIAKDGQIFADWWNEQSRGKKLVNGKEGKFKVGTGHTHPKDYGPIFSHAGGGDFGVDYGSHFEFRESALFDVNPCASNIDIVGAPDMGLIGANEAKENGVVVFHPIRVSVMEASSEPEGKDKETAPVISKLIEYDYEKGRIDLPLGGYRSGRIKDAEIVKKLQEVNALDRGFEDIFINNYDPLLKMMGDEVRSKELNLKYEAEFLAALEKNDKGLAMTILDKTADKLKEIKDETKIEERLLKDGYRKVTLAEFESKEGSKDIKKILFKDPFTNEQEFYVKEGKAGAENKMEIKDNKGEEDKYAEFRDKVRKGLHVGKGRHEGTDSSISGQIEGNKEKLNVFIEVMEEEVEKAKNLDSLGEIFNTGWSVIQNLNGTGSSEEYRPLLYETGRYEGSSPLLGGVRSKLGLKMKELRGKGEYISEEEAKKTINEMFRIDMNKQEDLNKIIEKLIAV